MNVISLLKMQKALDGRIRKEHNLVHASLIREKTLSLLVELGELANETKCFKFWSKKPPSEKERILEEFVDGLHFVFSLCIELDISLPNANHLIIHYHPKRDLMEDFLRLYEQIMIYSQSIGKKELEKLLHMYVSFGIKLGFTLEQIEQAYIAKNQINHIRQDNGY